MRPLKFVILISYMCFGFIATSQEMQLRLLGNDSIEQHIIDSIYQPTKFKNTKSITVKIDSLLRFLQRKGFIEAEILKKEIINDSLFETKLHLNKKFYTIYIYNHNNLVSKDVLERFSDTITDDYFIVNIPEIENTLKSINEELINNGLPFSTVILGNITKLNSENLKAEIQINSNEKRSIDKIIVKGYENFPKSYLKHYLKLRPNTSFNLEEISNKTEKINTLSFATETKSPEIQFTKDSTSVYLYVNKNTSNFFDGYLGFGSNEDNGKLEFNGYLDLNLTNNLNYGESLNLIYKSDENEQRTFEVNIVLPYLLGSPIGTEFSLNIFKKDSTFTTTSQKVNLFYSINSKNKLYVGLNTVQSNTLSAINSVNTADFKSSFFNTTYEFINPNFKKSLFPINMYGSLSFGFGNRKNDSETQKQFQLQLDIFKIFNLNNKNSIYLRINSQGIESDNFFENELLRFGGINSIRGFEENSLTATKFGVINSEYRYQLSPTIYIHSIIDAAYYENQVFDEKEKLLGFGFGFGVLTQAGLIKFNYANGKSENRNFKLSNSKVHISIISKF